MSLKLRNLSKSFGSKSVLHGVNLDLPEGQIGAILGASGAGKSTLLALVAGLERPRGGTIMWRDKVWDDADTHVPTHRRSIGMVFQDLALFPHLTVAENIAFGLRMRHASQRQRKVKVESLLRLTRLEGLEARYPNQISGGQQQRVAVARALAVDPEILLFDESLSALDAKLRAEIRVELKELIGHLGLTALFVTHDPLEAMVLADRLFVMSDGELLASGPPEVLYRQPPSKQVGEALGPASFWPVEVLRVTGQEATCRLRGNTLHLNLDPALQPGSYLMMLRPTSCHITQASDGDTIPATVEGVSYTGGQFHVKAKVPSGDVLQVLHPERPDGDVHLKIDPEGVHLIADEGSDKEAAL